MRGNRYPGDSPTVVNLAKYYKNLSDLSYAAN